MKEFEVKTTIKITAETVKYLLSCAFQGMSYWGDIQNIVKKDDSQELIEAVSLGEGSFEVTTDDEDTVYKVDQRACLEGLQTLADKYDWHFKNVLSEDFDAETGDAFIQCVCFGRIVYG